MWCRPSLVDLEHQVDDGLAGFGVEVRGGFVGEDDQRIGHERPCDRDPLPLPAREFIGTVMHEILETHAGQDLFHPRL